MHCLKFAFRTCVWEEDITIDYEYQGPKYSLSLYHWDIFTFQRGTTIKDKMAGFSTCTVLCKLVGRAELSSCSYVNTVIRMHRATLNTVTARQRLSSANSLVSNLQL